MRRALHIHVGMTLEAFKALPWYVANSIEEGLAEEFGDGEITEHEGTTEDLAGMGFDARTVE